MELFSQESEHGYLITLLNTPSLIEKTLWVKPNYFYFEQHQKIFAEYLNQLRHGYKPDWHSIMTALPDVRAYITESMLPHNIISRSNGVYYAEQIHKYHARRELKAFQENIEKALPEDDIGKSVLDLAKQMNGIADSGLRQSSFYTFGEAVDIAADHAGAMMRGEIQPISTGYQTLDELISLQKGFLVTLAARPGMGKTAMAINMAYRIASKQKPVLFFSLEMPVREITLRAISIHTGCPYWKLNKPRDTETDLLYKARHELSNLPLYIDELAKIRTADIEARCREVKRRVGLECVFIDYLGLMTADDSRANKVHQIEQITTDIKDMAKRLGVPVILLSQLSRSLEMREDKTPMLTDLRDSGAIEQDSDIVMFIHRPEYYIRETTTRNIGESQERFLKRSMQEESDRMEWAGKAQIVVAKNRHGKTGDIVLNWKQEQMMLTE